MSGPVSEKEYKLIGKYFSSVIAFHEVELIIHEVLFIIAILIIAAFSFLGCWGWFGE